MNQMVIKLDADGNVYRDDKLIATVTEDNEIKWKHWSYRNKHAAEVESLMGDFPDPEPEAEQPTPKGTPDTPSELFLEGNGRVFGEENPPVVLWRKANWSNKEFNKKYGHQTELLKANFAHDGLTYE